MIALSIVVAVHIAIAGWLRNLHVSDVPSHARDDALIVEFIVPKRPVRAEVRGVMSPIAGDRKPEVRGRASSAEASRTAAGRATVAGEPMEAAALDLRLPDAPLTVAPAPGGIVERAVRLPSRATRFEQNWAPDGNALDAASWRSPIVRGALGLFGGPPRKCDEVERRLRRPDCLPDEDDFERR
ncbi:hypothetical protein [Lysobacter humi (ex Lee et al. 2017)]